MVEAGRQHRYRFPPEKRLRKREDFASVYSRGRSWVHPLLRIHVLPNDRGETRFGFVTGKRVGKAVIRNRVKRRLRELARQMALRPGYDVVIAARPDAAARPYRELGEGLSVLLRRANLLLEERT